ncbi:hypothetical protein JTE90_002635 [Oedothorax gibbosus]|uniref:Protein kinase domain-containing protein n=1 Tax=Oedothorax gibbosus TaxID=931172 RepID=A0AAV6VH91_9ARAC|nr:hypothetical protein JTE90_002635 [Oedothorax gibbosus]
MNSCHSWLDCDAKLTLVSTISTSVVKTVYLAKWEGHNVALSVLTAKKYEPDFQQNLFMIKSLTGKGVIQLLGYCNDAIITKYHELGSALNANYHLRNSLIMYDNLKVRLNLCVSYVTLLEQLHTSLVGVRVMCDSNTLAKTLSQYLLTEDFKLVVNDLDATPEDLGDGVICGQKAITGTFVAPEQLWPYENEEYDPEKMPPYDEKTDIYKIPDVCNWFLGNSSEADILKYKLFKVHKNCKHSDPKKRPNATMVLDVYERILKDISE